VANIGIIGVGITGLTSGLVLQRAGHDVHIVSLEDIKETTSWASGAISYPFGIEQTPRVLDWYLYGNSVLEEMMDDRKAGVSIANWRKLSLHDTCEVPFWLESVGGRVLSSDECPAPYNSGIAATLPMIGVDEYYPYLFEQFIQCGGRFSVGSIESLNAFAQEYDLVVNAAGVYAGQLCGDDSVYPARGQSVVIKNPGVTQHTALFDKKFYLYPRGDQILLGGCYEEYEWSREVDEALTAEILAWVKTVEPLLETPEVIDVRVGLRPMRESVRIEKEVLDGGGVVVHNYGQGGAGYTVSWGCAEEVLKIVEAG